MDSHRQDALEGPASAPLWERLVRSIRNGSAPSGASELSAYFERGLRALLRNQSSREAARRSRQALEELESAIRLGKVASFAEAVRHLYETIKRHRGTGDACPQMVPAPDSGELGSRIEAYLRSVPSFEREALILYYTRGASADEIEAKLGVDRIGFGDIRKRFLQGVREDRTAMRVAVGFAGDCAGVMHPQD